MSNGDFWPQSTWQTFNGNPTATPPTPGLLKTTMGPIEVAQQVFTPVSTGNDNSIPADTVDPVTGVPTTGVTRAVATLQYPFQLAPAQVNDPGLTIATNQVTLAAQALALAEDQLFFYGQNAALPMRPAAPAQAGLPLVNVTPADLQKLNTGLMGIAGANRTIPVPSAPGAGAWGAATYIAVLEAIAEFARNAQGPPYALILAPDVFADTYIYVSAAPAAPARGAAAPPVAAPVAGLIRPADVIQPLLASGPFVASAGLNPQQGLFASLGGKTTTLYVGTGPLVEFNTYANSVYSFTARESIQFVNVDPRSLIMLEFQ